MSEKVKISIIVPVYNVEKYLSECLESLVNQTLGDIEIICVNDGSTDGSLKILEEYAQKDARIKIISQENGGLSFARNRGIEQANGEFIAFVDSDDWVDEDFLEKLYNAAVKNDCDIAASTIIRKRPNAQKYRVHYTEERVFNTLEEKINICKIPVCCYVWNKLYRAELVKSNFFKEGVYFEDCLWTPKVLEASKKLVTVPDTNYYYRATKGSIVKTNSPKKQNDSYNSKKYLIEFFARNNLPLSKKARTITKEIKYFCGIPVLKIKEFENSETALLFNLIPLYNVKTLFKPKNPIIKNNTFIVWEPCSQSHSEVVPGYVKYLLDLGYNVSVLLHPNRLKEGLFSRFDDKRIYLNKMTKKQIKKYFKTSNLDNIEGVLVTTVGKICDEVHFDDAYKTFNDNVDKSKLFFVSHEASHAVDNGTWREENITLRELNYKSAKSVVVNPHYFGKIEITPKNSITNFVTVGAIRPNKKNENTIIEAVKKLNLEGITNFKITVIGKGHIKNIPSEIRKYFEIKGRLPFNKMYEELEKADFLLTSYDEENPIHIRYNTTGTSGNFQLVYGFVKPVVITKGFAPINEFNEQNSIIYETPQDYADAMKRGIELTAEQYIEMQNNLKSTAERIYQKSLSNLEKLING